MFRWWQTCQDFITSAEREVKDKRSSGVFQSCTGGPEVTSECPVVASELVRDISSSLIYSFTGKEIIMRKN